MAHEQQVVVERVGEYSDDIAAAIGRLIPFLSKGDTGEPISEELLRKIIESPDREQLVARLEGRVVGSAVLNTIVGNRRQKAWLEDFVRDKSIDVRGIGDKIWQEMFTWCQERGLQLMDFTSGKERAEAHSFYIHHGARVRPSNAYRADIPEAGGE